MLEDELDYIKVSETLVDCNYNVERAADRLGIGYMDLDAFVESHPRLKSLLTIGNANPTPLNQALVRQPTLPAETIDTEPFDEDKLTIVLSTCGLKKESIEKNIKRAKYYRCLIPEAAAMINMDGVANYLQLYELAEASKLKIEANEFDSLKERQVEYDLYTKLQALMLSHNKAIQEARLIEARINKIQIAAKFTAAQNQGRGVEKRRGRPGWEPKVKGGQTVNITTPGPVHLHESRGKNGNGID